jgi:hypothetical protein
MRGCRITDIGEATSATVILRAGDLAERAALVMTTFTNPLAAP